MISNRILPIKEGKSLVSHYHFSDYLQIISHLVFNSIDANANSIFIDCNIASKTLSITDNGSGFDHLEFVSLYQFCPLQESVYASKGSALYHLSHIARKLSITSKLLNMPTFELLILDSKKHHFKAIPALVKIQNHGSIVQLDGIFSNIPVRSQCVNTDKQHRLIIAFVQSISICHHHIKFTLKLNNSKSNHPIVFQKSASFTDSFKILFGYNRCKSIKQIEFKDKYTNRHDFEFDQDDCEFEYSLKGFYSFNTDEIEPKQFLYINQRPVHETSPYMLLIKSIIIKTNNVMNATESLDFVIFLTVPKRYVDISILESNIVSPNDDLFTVLIQNAFPNCKKPIVPNHQKKFKYPTEACIQPHLLNSYKRIVSSKPIIPKSNRSQQSLQMTVPMENSPTNESNNSLHPFTKNTNQSKPKTDSSNCQSFQWTNPIYQSTGLNYYYNRISKSNGIKTNQSFTKLQLKSIVVINQVDTKFILCTLPEVQSNLLFVLDQHAVDERIQLERNLSGFDHCISPVYIQTITFEVYQQSVVPIEPLLNNHGFVFKSTAVGYDVHVVRAYHTSDGEMLAGLMMDLIAWFRDPDNRLCGIAEPVLNYFKSRACRYFYFLTIERQLSLVMC
ncbi:hypothetical protein BC833DRAFT_583070 [Globomyces pollinis-pini]|nr:hypothetical protein BC833DRAFT_583070 [Globomyces pollinis-pini]